MNFSRRRLLDLISSGCGAVVLGPHLLGMLSLEEALAQGKCDPTSKSQRRKFVFYIHCGSWDGMASGLIQPNMGARPEDRFPVGIFSPGQNGMSLNPLINEHTVVGNHVFHNYSRILEPISKHMCFGLGNPQSLGHSEAQVIQSTGARTLGLNPGWVAGLAQMISPASETFTSAISFGGGVSAAAFPAGIVKKVATPAAESLADYLRLIKDPPSIKDGPRRDSYTNIVKKLASQKLGIPSSDPLFTGALKSSLDNFGAGLKNADELTKMMQAAMSTDKINAIIDSSGAVDRPVIKATGTAYNGLKEAFILAGMLIESGTASGITYTLDNQDLHGGGSYTQTTRSAAQMWAQVVAFWRWVESKGRQDDVLIVLSHEFSRTAYNTTGNMSLTLTSQDTGRAAMTFADPGKDHHLAHGMVFINGKLPASSRMGGLGDGYTPLGTNNFEGSINKETPAYTSVAMVGSILQRIWCDVFPNERAVRAVWPNYTDDQIIKWVVS